MIQRTLPAALFWACAHFFHDDDANKKNRQRGLPQVLSFYQEVGEFNMNVAQQTG